MGFFVVDTTAEQNMTLTLIRNPFHPLMGDVLTEVLYCEKVLGTRSGAADLGP